MATVERLEWGFPLTRRETTQTVPINAQRRLIVAHSMICNPASGVNRLPSLPQIIPRSPAHTRIIVMSCAGGDVTNVRVLHHADLCPVYPVKCQADVSGVEFGSNIAAPVTDCHLADCRGA
jgi:hypothetical protein